MSGATMRPIKIATMVRGILPVPRPKDIMYSPLDVAVSVSELLTKRGHTVSFYGPTGSQLNVSDVQTCCLRPLIHNNREWQDFINTTDLFMDYIPSLYDQKLVQEMFRRASAGEYDILHFHHPESAMPYARLYPKVPVVYTLHDQLDSMRREMFEAFATPNQHFISISNNQRQGAPNANYAGTVYNGVDTSLFKPNGGAEDYLLSVGRIVPDKGVKEAVEIAQQTNSRLLIIGQVRDADQWYFDMYVKPHLNDKILFLGHIEHEQLVAYYQKAKALLMPIQWEEPFGLAMTEAMACGTPVIALRRGSVPEVVVHGKTGYICDHIQEMITAVGKIDKIDRRDCRRHVEKHFSNAHMIEGYERVFHEIIDKATADLTTPAIVRKKLQRLPRQLRSKLQKKK